MTRETPSNQLGDFPCLYFLDEIIGGLAYHLLFLLQQLTNVLYPLKILRAHLCSIELLELSYNEPMNTQVGFQTYISLVLSA